MGSGVSGAYLGTSGGSPGHSFSDNEQELIDRFGINENGYFGHAGQSSGIRQIDSENSLATAQSFADIAAQGGEIVRELPNGGWVACMADGSYITFRPSSRSDSPAVDLNIVDSNKVQSQKIHFEEE